MQAFTFFSAFAFDVLFLIHNSNYGNNSLQSVSNFSPLPFSAELWHFQLETVFILQYMKTSCTAIDEKLFLACSQKMAWSCLIHEACLINLTVTSQLSQCHGFSSYRQSLNWFQCNGVFILPGLEMLQFQNICPGSSGYITYSLKQHNIGQIVDVPVRSCFCK